MTLITCQPLGNLRARCLQNRRQLPAGAPLRIQHYRLQPLGYAIGSVPFRLFAQSNQPLIGARTQMNHSGKHGTPPTESMPSFFLNVPLLMRVCIVATWNVSANNISSVNGAGAWTECSHCEQSSFSGTNEDVLLRHLFTASPHSE